ADDTGAVIATDTTDANGFYRFNQFDIKGTGDFTVSVVVPSGFIGTTPTSVDVLISRGDINARVNFGVDANWSGSAATGGASGASGAAASSASAPADGQAPVADDGRAAVDAVLSGMLMQGGLAPASAGSDPAASAGTVLASTAVWQVPDAGATADAGTSATSALSLPDAAGAGSPYQASVFVDWLGDALPPR